MATRTNDYRPDASSRLDFRVVGFARIPFRSTAIVRLRPTPNLNLDEALSIVREISVYFYPPVLREGREERAGRVLGGIRRHATGRPLPGP